MFNDHSLGVGLGAWRKEGRRRNMWLSCCIRCKVERTMVLAPPAETFLLEGGVVLATKGMKVGEKYEVFGTKNCWAGQVQHWFRIGLLWAMMPALRGPHRLQNVGHDGFTMRATTGDQTLPAQHGQWHHCIKDRNASATWATVPL